jgi:hypothetical protein
MNQACAAALFLLCQTLLGSAAEWVRAGVTTNQLVWGLRGGLLWAVPPAGFRQGEPRGLIRLGAPVLRDGNYDLVNFLAIEPIVRGRRGYSELEASQLDGKPGKGIYPACEHLPGSTNLCPGSIKSTSDGAETLEVPLLVERFDNGAHVRLMALQRSSKADELEIQVFQEPDSAPLEYCIITATMGNMARTRLLWLKHRVVSSLELYAGYHETGFAPHEEFHLPQLVRNAAGDVVVAVTTNEKDPAAVFPFKGTEHWHYAGVPVTQYWSVPSEDVQPDLRVVVNGRYTYWRSKQPVPGGIAFENFEVCEKFHQEQRFVFGITRTSPTDPGL